MRLDKTPLLMDPDAPFAAIIVAHRELDAAASRRLGARLVLILANHIGDAEGAAAGDRAGTGHRAGLTQREWAHCQPGAEVS
jgi:hypothetical protein